ncbi:carboxypeptidase N subunit 2-like protein [Cricetulus griseus]|nr:carboxypeptidase N subunit 2-like protein [Cricetulus griseus]
MFPGSWLCWASLLLLARPTQSCPMGCDCFDREVFCTDQQLATIPLDIPSHVTDIVFVETTFTTVETRAFSNNSNLTKVVFLNTLVCHLEPDAFGGLPRLEDLELTGSSFSNLSADIFSNLSSLGKLTLDFDRLVALPEDLFHHMDNLESLQLQGNQLQTLPGRLFQPLSDMVTVQTSEDIAHLFVVIYCKQTYSASSHKNSSARQGAQDRFRINYRKLALRVLLDTDTLCKELLFGHPEALQEFLSYNTCQQSLS